MRASSINKGTGNSLESPQIFQNLGDSVSSLSDVEKRYFENLLGMSSGYVLDFSDTTFGEFFGSFGVPIHNQKYQRYGTSKAKKLRAFWDVETDSIVAKVLSELLDSYEASCELQDRQSNTKILAKCREAVGRIRGNKQTPQQGSESKSDFLDREFSIPNLHKLPVEEAIMQIISARLKEARIALKNGANLSVIFLCGSILEAVLLGAAQSAPRKFNTAPNCPKRDGKVKPFHDWSLAELIDVATGIDILKPDVQKYSHGLRDFRNYIHPYQQLVSGFSPDQHTAKVSFQVLKAALASVAGERS